VALKSVFTIDVLKGAAACLSQCKVEKTVMQDKSSDTLMLQLIVFIVQKQVSWQITVIL